MKIYKHFTANDIKLKAFPFKRELLMQAYLIENEGILALDQENDTFNEIEFVDAEVSLKEGRLSKGTDGRIDILATYSKEYIAVIELKIGELNEDSLSQLEDYLKKKEEILKKFPDILDKEIVKEYKWVGVLVGSSISADLAKKLKDGYLLEGSKIQIAALTIQRFRGEDGSVYVTTDIFINSQKLSKDTTKYLFERGKYGKGRLVLAVIKHHCESKPNITFEELKKDFPDDCQGSYGVFSLKEDADKIFEEKGTKRHFIKPNESIELYDKTVIAVCTEWGLKNIGKFIKIAKEIGYEIK